jgi:hypothetical protein
LRGRIKGVKQNAAAFYFMLANGIEWAALAWAPPIYLVRIFTRLAKAVYNRPYGRKNVAIPPGRQARGGA